MTHPGIYRTLVYVETRGTTYTMTFDGELAFDEAAQRTLLKMTYADVKQIQDIFVTHVKSMTKLDKPVLGWGS